MLRPYAAALGLRQLGPRQGLRRLHVRLVECVDSQTGAQLLRGVLPRHELRAQREGIGGELAHDLTVGAWRREWVINDGDDAASAFAGALRHQLLDPVGQSRHRRGRPQHQLVPPREHTLGDPPPAHPRGVRVDGERPLEQNATVHAEQRGGQHADHGEGGVAAAHVRRMGEHRAEAALARQGLERAPGIGDRHEARRVGASGEVVIERESLDGAPGLAAHDEQCAVEIRRARHGEHGARIGAVEHGQRSIREAGREHRRCETRPAHPAHDGVGQAIAPRRVGEAHQLVPLGKRDARRGPPGQLVWSYYELIRRVSPPYPSLADVGFLGVYVCFLVAVTKLVGAAPRRRFDHELLIDTVLVTLTAGALAYEFLLKPLFDLAGNVPSLLTSLGWSVGGIGVLWLILVELLRHTRVPLAAAGVVTALGVLCVTNVLYAVAALRGTFRSGGVLDLGWDAGLLLLAAAAAVAPAAPPTAEAGARATSGNAARIAALVIGLAGIGTVAIRNALSAEPDAGSAVLIALAVGIIGLRLVHSTRADRRYATLLENEVASQTRSLMDSLAATAGAERNLRLLMNAVPDSIVVVDREGRILESNGPTRVMGAMSGPPENRNIFEFLAADAAVVVREKLAAAFRGEIQRFEVPFSRDDATHGVAAALYAPIRAGSGLTRVLILGRDITEQRRSESQFQQAEKLAAMGQLVSGVAHEINNPAAIISGFAQTLLLDELKPEHREMLQMMYDEATRIGRITSNLLAFARAGSKQRALVDMNDIARRTFALRSYHLSTLNIAVSLDLDPSEPKIWADASELQQMILNLLINAEQALVTVDGPRTIVVRTRTDEGEARLEIADSGPGIPAEIRSKIFDPFFTTKPEGVGTGLGLSICYGIAREHGGRIWVESEPGQGARFAVTLPRDPREESRPEPTVPPRAAPPGADLHGIVGDAG